MGRHGFCGAANTTTLEDVQFPECVVHATHRRDGDRNSETVYQATILSVTSPPNSVRPVLLSLTHPQQARALHTAARFLANLIAIHVGTKTTQCA
jgi:hypothetical protein